jgi:hypothetical protein
VVVTLLALALACPASPLPLAKADLPQARAAVLRYVHGPWARKRGMDVRGATATAKLASATVRGGYARIHCGKLVWRRTAVVSVGLPRYYPAISVATPVFYVSRTRARWKIWFQIH